jgi:hypothetical protein
VVVFKGDAPSELSVNVRVWPSAAPAEDAPREQEQQQQQ